ncbi:MAG: serine hydrolase, partial [Acidobacteria bacterium]|nr:serine hydrolase [Acidobacteriota bacterium]
MLLFALLVVGQTLAPFREVMDGAMLPDTAVYTFSHSDQLLPVRKVPRGGRVRSLVTSDRKLATLAIPSGGRVYDLYDYLSMNRVAGLLILKDGKVVREDYQLTATANTRWASFSLAKSITSTLIGAAIVDGHIKSLDDRVEQYVPELASGAYAKVTVRQLLQMASGVKWDETYTDPNSDRRKLLEIQLKREPGATLRFMNSL